MSTRALSRSLAKAVVDANQTAAHCSVTIAARLPVLAGCLFAPSGAALAEWNRAYTEKVAAGIEGAAAASAEWQAALVRSAFRPLSAASLAHDWLRVVDKGLHPARKKVRANARRFTAAKAKSG